MPDAAFSPDCYDACLHIRTKANRQALDRDLAEWREACIDRDSFMRTKRANAAKEAAATALERGRAELAALLVYGAARMQTLSDAVLEARARRKVGSKLFIPVDDRSCMHYKGARSGPGSSEFQGASGVQGRWKGMHVQLWGFVERSMQLGLSYRLEQHFLHNRCGAGNISVRSALAHEPLLVVLSSGMRLACSDKCCCQHTLAAALVSDEACLASNTPPRKGPDRDHFRGCEQEDATSYERPSSTYSTPSWAKPAAWASNT